MKPLRIAHVAPVATTVPPPRSGSVETMTALLTDGLVERGHDVTLFATADSTTTAKLHATYPHGYRHDQQMWPWEMYELLNLAAAIERASGFDIIHYEAEYYPMSLAFARISSTPVLQTLHYSPGPSEIRLWSMYPEAPFVAISDQQARLLKDLNVVATVLHAVDTDGQVFESLDGGDTWTIIADVPPVSKADFYKGLVRDRVKLANVDDIVANPAATKRWQEAGKAI